MKDSTGHLLYVGKAGNLRRRVSSYFLLARRSFSGEGRSHDARIQKLISEIERIDYRETDTALEALILEADLIKKFHPPFNIREKDDKSFLYVEITKEKFPRVVLVRGKDVHGSRFIVRGRYGPFTSASSIREALRILRRIFPWSTHTEKQLSASMEHGTKELKPCFDYEVGLCPGTCIGAITREEYAKNIRNIRLFFSGKKKKILHNLEKEMVIASKKLEFERAGKIRRQIFALQHIRDIALIKDERLRTSDLESQTSQRIEGYDISNISGTSAVGSMVAFANGEPDKREYRKFKIRTIRGANDVGMLKEVLRRRFSRSLVASGKVAEGSWPLPDLILIDGGRGQVNAARGVLFEAGLKIPIVGIAKGAKRKRNDLIGILPSGIDRKILIRVRDEAHRFAIKYHKKIRGREFFK
ncbi:MAG: UvrB/UvrC motif-containing protein [Candidatus Liptonbacteria bacterium]|nr:UvrB/UvrC motif-containing protein [Candidatus Liptonbacteria bacterium]